MRVRKVSSNDVKLYDLTQVKLKTAGNTSVIQFTAGNNKSCPVRNLSKDEYLDKKTGEVKEKNKSKNRQQVPKSVRKSINKLMDLIRCNATDSAKCRWLTVTYEEVMTDGHQAFLDAKLFLRRLKRYLAKQFIKGERLKYYPAGMNIYSSSRGMKRPEVEEMTNAEAMERVGDAELVYRETYSIGTDDKGNLIDKRYYKKKGK